MLPSSIKRGISNRPASIKVRLLREMCGSLSDISDQRSNDVDDIRSIGTVSSSDCNTHDTTFSASLPHLRIHSPSTTTPSQSRPESPVRASRIAAMESDLRGIGDQAKPPTAVSFGASLPIHSRHFQRHQSPLVNPGINMVATHTSDSPSPPTAPELGKNAAHIANEDENNPTPRTSSPASYRSGLGTVHRYSEKLLLSNVPTVYDGLSSSDDSDGDDEGLDLEAIADDALSQWFGISLSRLVRPVRVIYAFGRVKEQCASILQDEGHYLYGDQSDQSEPCDPLDGNNSSHVSQSHHDQPVGSGAPGSSAKRRLSGDQQQKEHEMDESGTASPPALKVRGPNKKRRVPWQFSCPYRKHNPLRFNVGDHDDCANKSYPDMSSLK